MPVFMMFVLQKSNIVNSNSHRLQQSEIKIHTKKNIFVG